MQILCNFGVRTELRVTSEENVVVFCPEEEVEGEKWAGQDDGGGGAERGRPGVQRHRGGGSSRGEMA